MEKLNSVILSLGSNIEDRLYYLKSAILHIKELIGDVKKVSSIYESKALGFESDIDFLNLCIEIETTFSPIELLKKTQEIELYIGRTKKSIDSYESRKIDIDIIFFGKEIINTETLTIPHKLFKNRLFVLLPLKEIYKGSYYPENIKDIIDLIKKCEDKSDLKKTTYTL